jgi:CHAT domain-containing protein/Tfp pilus assembly protein PilF
MTDPRPCSFRRACRTIILACLTLVLPAVPRAFGQVPATSKPSPPLTAQQQERLKERDQFGKQAVQLRSQGKLPEAIQAAEAMLALEREVLGETSEDAIGSLELLARLHQDREDWAAARKVRKEALKLLSTTLPKDHWQVVDARWALDNIDSLAKLSDRDRRRLREANGLIRQVEDLYARGKYSDAVGPARQTLTIREALLGACHPDVSQSLDALGRLALAQANYGDALAYFQRALQMNQALHPRERYPQGHPRMTITMNNLASVLYAQGDYGAARGYYQRALEMNQALYPKERYPRGHAGLASELANMGLLLQALGNEEEARGYLQRALEMHQSLYPKEQYPQGHAELATDLSNMGFLLQAQVNYGEARVYLQRALEMFQTLYPKERYPQGHPRLARSVLNLGHLLQAQGNYVEARVYLEQAVEMFQTLYPKERYPQGHPELAASLNSMGRLLSDQGNLGEARGYQQRVLEMVQAFYPKEQYPQGHHELATSLNNMGGLLQTQGNYAEARGYFKRALEMNQALYPKERYPQGQRELAASLNNMGLLLWNQDNYEEARGYFQRALEMSETLYPRGRYPQGHPRLALGLNNLGGLLEAQGNYAEARGYLQRALEMDQALYPKEQYPQGHPDLELGLCSLGHLLRNEGKYPEAWPFLIQAADLSQDLAEVFLAATSEAEALDYLAQLPSNWGSLLSSSLHLPESAEAAYARVWRGKAAVARTLQRRQAFLFDLAKTDSATRQTIEAWQECRRQLARLLRAPSNPDRLKQLQELTRDKERLERQLAEALPEFAHQQKLDQRPHSRLLETLPDRMVVLDLVQFTRFEQDPQVKGRGGERRTPSYVGFVLARGRPVRRVDLGPAQPIDEAVAQWRKAIVARQPSAAAATLRRRVWEPLAQHIPSQTTTVIIAPDGLLTAIPWAALPGDRSGTVLLEQYAIALVPHAPFLLDRLTAPAPSRDQAGLVLALGGVVYGQAPKPVEDEKTKVELLAVRQAETQRGRGDGWTELPGTREELETVVHLARARGVVRLEGTAASTAGLLRALPQARWAHIATHGFFADPTVPSVLRPDPRHFARSERDRAAPGARNPLVLSGLVLAGANRPSADVDATTHDDLGILTAEAIAGLPLQDLELVVLSACETGLGTVAGGEGVFGLQRAFHLAGARTVVASLWKVDDTTTQKLMRLFYSNLWERGMPAAEALRQAQLTVLSEAVGSGDKPYYWAGWVLSGDPRIR